MKFKCDICQKVCDYPMSKWAWVRYKGTFQDKLVCPECRQEAEAQKGNIISPARCR